MDIVSSQQNNGNSNNCAEELKPTVLPPTNDSQAPNDLLTPVQQASRLSSFLQAVYSCAKSVDSPPLTAAIKRLIQHLVTGALSPSAFYAQVHARTQFPIKPHVVPFMAQALTHLRAQCHRRSSHEPDFEPLWQQLFQAVDSKSNVSLDDMSTSSDDNSKIVIRTYKKCSRMPSSRVLSEEEPTEQQPPPANKLAHSLHIKPDPLPNNAGEPHAKRQRLEATSFTQLNAAPTLTAATKRCELRMNGRHGSGGDSRPPATSPRGFKYPNNGSLAPALSAVVSGSCSSAALLTPQSATPTSPFVTITPSTPVEPRTPGGCGGLDSLADSSGGGSGSASFWLAADWASVEQMLSNMATTVERLQRTTQSLQQKARAAQMWLSARPAIQHSQQQQHIQQQVDQAVADVKRAAMAELQKAVSAAQQKANVALSTERQHMDTILSQCNKQEDSIESCWNCGRRAGEACSACGVARYCGAFCQHRDWARHKLMCASLVARGSKAAAALLAAHATHGASLDNVHLLSVSSQQPPPPANVASVTGGGHHVFAAGSWPMKHPILSPHIYHGVNDQMNGGQDQQQQQQVRHAQLKTSLSVGDPSSQQHQRQQQQSASPPPRPAAASAKRPDSSPAADAQSRLESKSI